MLGLRIDLSAELSELLEPLLAKFDAAWWYLNGYGMQFEKLLNETEGLSPPGALKTGSREELERWLQDNQEWLKANERQMSRVIDEYECWMDDSTSFRVGLPGWFSRYVDYAETCWAGYVVCESDDGDPPSEAMSFLRQSDPGWEQDPATFTFPPEVIFACQNVDDAYWNFYFRDEAELEAVREHVERLEGRD